MRTEFRNTQTELYYFQLRIGVAGAVVLAAFALLLGRFFYLQVVQHEYFRTKAEDNRISIVPIQPNRGNILDRNGQILARNYSAYTVEIAPSKGADLEGVDYGVDFDGDGRVNLLTSAPDALASAANYLKHLGWRAGEPWLREVRVPQSLAWDQADVAIKLPLSRWAALGVTLPAGKALPTGGPDASLLLPMGRNGPAFLAYANFDAYLQWNSSLVYSTTAAYFATRLAGAPKVGSGAGATPLSAGQVRAVQKLLRQRGYDVGKIDGVIGVLTRAAVKDVQMKFGLPADSYPDAALLSKLGG